MYYTKIILALFISFVFYSCSPLYIPNNVNTPLLSERGEGTFSANIGTSGMNLQAAYAPIENFSLMFNYCNMNEENDYDNSDDKYVRKQRFGELALGYFHGIGESSVAEVYFGGGIGNASSIENYLLITHTKVYANSKYYRWFIQSDFGLKTKIFEGGICLRGCYVNFTEVKYPYYGISVPANNYFFEPTMFLRLGGPLLKFQAQVGFSTKLGPGAFVNYDPFILGIGINLRIGSSKLNK